ncbi:hypothetical protein S40288_00421 [Stachybotrys chartarum IBT 40288]|nr:hypothetical protein S40288_00421 [Stachybotrys chartarum IBT 40288]
MDESPNKDAFPTHRAARAFAVEAMCMFILSSLVIGLRIYIRVRQIGFKNLTADDYLMLLVLPFFASEIAVAFVSGNRFHGLLNSGMTDEERAGLLPESQEFLDRVNGSKFQIVAWCIYATIVWTIKASLCAFYFRMTDDEVGPHRAARWAVRECCLAIIASNLPIIWGWMRGALKPMLSSLKAPRAFKKRRQDGSIKLSDYPERSTFESGMKPTTTRASLGHETTTSIVADADGHGKSSLEFLSSSPAARGGILKQTEVRIQTTTRDMV